MAKRDSRIERRVNFRRGSRSCGGRLEGNGDVVVGPVGNATNSGSVAPGLSPGALTISGGDYVQTASGTLEIEISGTDPAHSTNSTSNGGEAILDGILDVSLLSPFSPHAGDSFEILSAEDGLSGMFATENLPALTGQLFWIVDYDTVADVVVLRSSHHLAPTSTAMAMSTAMTLRSGRAIMA